MGSLSSWASFCWPVKIRLTFRIKYETIPMKSGIPRIRPEKTPFLLPSVFRQPPSQIPTGFRIFRKYGNGVVKCRKRSGEKREKFPPFSTLAIENLELKEKLRDCKRWNVVSSDRPQ
jgi:hypothetical protein